MAEREPRDYLFDLGDSNTGPIGFCARIRATTKGRAVARLRDVAPEAIEYAAIYPDAFEKGESLNVYLNITNVGTDDIDEYAGCPKCGADYRDDLDRCPSCLQDVVDGTPHLHALLERAALALHRHAGTLDEYARLTLDEIEAIVKRPH